MNTEATPPAFSKAVSRPLPEAFLKDAENGLIASGVLTLPLLHKDTPTTPWRNKAAHIWPGLPNMPEEGYAALVGYPFAPLEAAACLADLEAMSMAGLSGVPLQALVAHENRPHSARELEELSALHSFAAAGQEGAAQAQPFSNDTLLRKAAQKILLGAWLLEERQREIRDLSRRFDSGAGFLGDALGVEEDADLVGLNAVGMHLGEEAGILPPWKLVLENAALFLPDPCVVIINDPHMAEAVTENCAEMGTLFTALETTTCASWGLHPHPEKHWASTALPLWKIMGLAAAADQRPWLNVRVHMVLPLPAACLGNQEQTA